MSSPQPEDQPEGTGMKLDTDKKDTMKPKWSFKKDDETDTHGRVYQIDDDGALHFRGFYSVSPDDPHVCWVRMEGSDKAQLVRFG